MSISKEELKQLIFDELEKQDFSFDNEGNLVPPSLDKEAVRNLHKVSRDFELKKAQNWIVKKFDKYGSYFANGKDIEPLKIKPKLILVSKDWHKDLFRLARYYWSIPYSSGFGRRLRYILIDENNNKLIGIFGLQSPPINFPARDKLFKYPDDKKTDLINQTMDIFTLGALPPYNRLLGGKLVGLSVVSNQVREDYRKKYSNKKTEMLERIIRPELVALTTTSAFGRSSIYNRLKYNTIPIAESLGYTNGYGNFHLQEIYPIIKEFLESEDISVKGGYGTGPKRTWQLLRKGFEKAGISGDMLKHGIKREAFLFSLIENLGDYLNGKSETPIYRDLQFDDLSNYWRERWLLGRFNRVDGWHKWDNEEVKRSLLI